MSTCSSNFDLIYFEDQSEGPLWLLFLLGFLQFWPISHFRSIVLLLPAPEVGSWSTAPPNSPSFSYLIFQRSVGSCAAGQFCFSVFIHPPPSLQYPFILLFSSSSPPPPSFSLSCPGSGADCSSIRRSRTWPFSERHLITDTAQQWTTLKLNYFVLIYSEMVCALTDVWQSLTKYYELDFTWIVA